MTLRELYERFFNTAKTATPEERAAIKQLGKNQAGRDWRDDAINAAAVKYNKPFKGGGESHDREVMIGSKYVVVKAGEKPKRPQPEQSAHVSVFKRGPA